MKTYGYCRISTAKQSIERQEINILAYAPDAVIMRETFTGTKIDRPVWNRLMKTVKQGDTIVFDEVSRMSRDAEEGFTVYQSLFDQGVNLVFLKQRYIDSSVYASKLQQADVSTGKAYIDEGLKVILLGLAREQIKIAFEQSQAEVDSLHKRTSEGVRRAQAEGKQVGRAAGAKVETKKAREMKERIRKMSRYFDGNMTDREILDALQIARNTYYKYKGEMKR